MKTSSQTSIGLFRTMLQKLNNFTALPLRITTFLLIVLLTSIASIANAQDLTARVTFEPQTSTQAIGICHVNLPDSMGWQSVEVELTDLMSNQVLFTREYVFDQTSGLPTGITWQREGTQVTMGMGTLPKKVGWKGRIRMKDVGGQWQTPYVFLFN